MGFFGNLFRNREDEEYREYLEREIDHLKEEKNKAIESERLTIQDLQRQLACMEEEKMQLSKELRELKEIRAVHEEELQKKLTDATIELGKLQEQVKEYQYNHEVVSRVLVSAQKDADFKIAEAEREADKITYQAKIETYFFKKKAEAEMKERYEADRQRFTEAKDKLLGSVDTINQAHDKLMAAYNQLGDFLKRMPMQADQLFPENAFEFVLEERPVFEISDLTEDEKIVLGQNENVLETEEVCTGNSTEEKQDNS